MLQRLFATIVAVCPIVGVQPVKAGTDVGKGNVVIDYDKLATASQMEAAENILAQFDWSLEAQVSWSVESSIRSAVGETMTGLTRGAISDRVILRYTLTAMNDIREHIGLSRIKEAEHIAAIQEAVAAGAGEPV